ncbi:protease PrsW [Salimicrobium jeotgali]|uniref:Protease PrsW n=2 Tax=Salimicrobium TaxID=351195 RepID=K2FNZ8_9BACI|nr:glutamic-type intramembrane protease PrsW [Salimicrobium jeotgali]AKG04394.1 protease PrsW [Salimicrobium jeotgali]EKE32586.1 protease PrsW [Salimicrobium jeotgali]PBB05478.1 PrsW family intramembrane metalloprotease [Salimicrobium humidisoli]
MEGMESGALNLALLITAVAPIIALMTYIYLNKKMELEPLSLIIRVFIVGCLLVFPIMFVQYGIEQEQYLTGTVWKPFLSAGFLEEFFKWFFFLFIVFKHENFDHHYDGIIYGVSLSLGFATVENIIYIFSNGIEIAFLRAVFPVSSHALFGLIMGYYMGKAKFRTDRKKWCIAFALVIPALLHGSYGYMVSLPAWLYSLLPFMVILWVVGFQLIKLANTHHLQG